MINKVGLSLALCCLVTRSAVAKPALGAMLDASDGLRSVSRLEQEIDHLCIADDDSGHTQSTQLGDAYAYLGASKEPEQLILICAHFYDSRRTSQVGAVDSNEGPTRSESTVGDALFYLFHAKFCNSRRHMDLSFAPYLETKESTHRWARDNHFDLKKMRAIFEEDKSKKK